MPFSTLLNGVILKIFGCCLVVALLLCCRIAELFCTEANLNIIPITVSLPVQKASHSLYSVAAPEPHHFDGVGAKAALLRGAGSSTYVENCTILIRFELIRGLTNNI
jgi:hypothetical protein